VSSPRRYSSIWSCNRKRHPTAEQLADQLRNSFCDILFHFVGFSSFPLQHRRICLSLCLTSHVSWHSWIPH
jgi:hypothetical protein